MRQGQGMRKMDQRTGERGCLRGPRSWRRGGCIGGWSPVFWGSRREGDPEGSCLLGRGPPGRQSHQTGTGGSQMMMGGRGKAPLNTWAKSGLKLSGTRGWDGLGGRGRRGSLPLRGVAFCCPHSAGEEHASPPPPGLAAPLPPSSQGQGLAAEKPIGAGRADSERYLERGHLGAPRVKFR